MAKTTQEQNEAFKTSAEALLALSEVAFSGFERLSALNLNMARSVFEDGMSATQSISRVKNANELKDLPSPFRKNASENLVNYFRSVQEIATDIQNDMISVMTRQMSVFGAGGTGTNPWVDMFTKVAQQASDMNKVNLKLATDAGDRKSVV